MSDESDRSTWSVGRQAAACNVGRARAVYEHCAQSGERSANALGASASRIRARLRAVAGATHGYDRFERDATRHWQGFREIAQRLLIASDTNVRAGFDCAERLVQARDPKDFLAVQAAFLRDQARRSMQQAVDLQQVTAEVARRVARRNASARSA